MSRARCWPPGLPLPEVCQPPSRPPPSCRPDPAPGGLSWGSPGYTMHSILLSDPQRDLSPSSKSGLTRAGDTFPPLLSGLRAGQSTSRQASLPPHVPQTLGACAMVQPRTPANGAAAAKEESHPQSSLCFIAWALGLEGGGQGCPRGPSRPAPTAPFRGASDDLLAFLVGGCPCLCS